LVVKSIFIQYFSKIITFPLSLIIYSLIVKSLSVEEFKDYNLFLAIVLYIIGFIDLGLGNFFYREAITKKKYYFFNILFNFKIVVFFIVIILYFLCFNFLNYKIAFFIILYVFLFVLKDVLEKLLKSFSRFDYIAYVNVGAVFFQFLLIVGLYYKKFLFLDVLLGVLCSILFVYVILYKRILNKKILLFKVNLKYFFFSIFFIKKNLKFMIPWIIIFLGNLIFSRLDVFMLNYFNFSYDIAEYGGSYNLYEKLEFFLLTISMVFYNVFADKKDIKLFSRILEVVMLISFLFVGMLLISSDLLVNLIIGDKYKNARDLFVIMVLGTYFKFHSAFFVNWLYLHKKEWGVGVGIILMLLLNGILNYIYIPIYKDIGAAYTTFISDAFNFLFLIVVMYKNEFKFMSKFYVYFNLVYILIITYFLIAKSINEKILIIILLFGTVVFFKNIKRYEFLKGIL